MKIRRETEQLRTRGAFLHPRSAAAPERVQGRFQGLPREKRCRARPDSCRQEVGALDQISRSPHQIRMVDVHRSSSIFTVSFSVFRIICFTSAGAASCTPSFAFLKTSAAHEPNWFSRLITSPPLSLSSNSASAASGVSFPARVSSSSTSAWRPPDDRRRSQLHLEGQGSAAACSSYPAAWWVPLAMRILFPSGF
jgi:hypothetical protein